MEEEDEIDKKIAERKAEKEAHLRKIEQEAKKIKKALKKAKIPNGFLRVFTNESKLWFAAAFARIHENKRRWLFFKRKDNKVRILNNNAFMITGTVWEFFGDVLSREVPDKYTVVSIADRPDVIADKWQKGKTNIAILVNPKDPVEKIEGYDSVYCIEI